MIDINNFAEGTTFEWEGKTIEIHYDVRSLLGIKLNGREHYELCYKLCYLSKGRTCTEVLDIIHGHERDCCFTSNNQGFRFYYRLKETDNVESDGQDASSKDRVD